MYYNAHVLLEQPRNNQLIVFYPNWLCEIFKFLIFFHSNLSKKIYRFSAVPQSKLILLPSKQNLYLSDRSFPPTSFLTKKSLKLHFLTLCPNPCRPGNKNSLQRLGLYSSKYSLSLGWTWISLVSRFPLVFTLRNTNTPLTAKVQASLIRQAASRHTPNKALPPTADRVGWQSPR